jgi:hypothetical protein
MKQIQTEINVNNDKKTRDKQRGPYQKTGENFGVPEMESIPVAHV